MTRQRKLRRGIRVLAGAVFTLALSATADTTLAQSVPQRVANPYFAPSSAAANSAATLSDAHVVYPATTANSPLANGLQVGSPKPSREGLPTNRVAALRAAVRVATLDEAYRAGVAARDIQPTAAATIEPSRFAPASTAMAMPKPQGLAATPTDFRRDTAVQPVAWLSDAPVAANTSSSISNRAPSAEVPQAGNPLRRDVASPVGNPLR